MVLTDREVADPDRPIEGTRWVVDGLIQGDAVSSTPMGVTASFAIRGGTIQIDTGCNTGSGPVTVTDTTLTIGALMLTKKACGPDAAAMESAVTSVLQGEVTYTIEADRLTVMHGAVGLMARATAT